ncbi:MAG: hypothetical protein ACO323_05120 [Candidatus Kapaibacteriota bacterium]
MNKKIMLFIMIFFVMISSAFAQVEHLPIVHPVYHFLEHCEAKGVLPHYSLSALPLQRGEVQQALRMIRKAEQELSEDERNVLKHFEEELLPEKRVNSTLFESTMSVNDTMSFFFDGLLSKNEKALYLQQDSLVTLFTTPLLSIETAHRVDSASASLLTGQAGLRMHGTLRGNVGFFFQMTNGALLSGDRSLALDDPRLRQNVKFAVYNSDFDFTESHVRYDNDWFYAGIGRETRTLGAGFNHHQFLGKNAPPLDALMIGARTKTFEYRYTHASMLSLPQDASGQIILPGQTNSTGSDKFMPAKTLVMHRAAFRPAWGEIAVWESVIYQDRTFDLAYLNPLSFLKSVEHSLRDRDNSAMGFDFTIRPMKHLILKGAYLLDDLIFSKIGSDYWSNKSAFSMGAMYVMPAMNISLEYARVQPYTYSHFNVQNSMTSDGALITGSLRPNSDELSIGASIFHGHRYPIRILLAYQRHGANEMGSINGKDTILVNHGANPLQAKRPNDSEIAPFLGGILEESLRAQITGGFELIRGLNVQGLYALRSQAGTLTHYVQASLRFEDF